MKIVVIGAGGVGGYFGAKMSKAGFDIDFIARGITLEAICKNGLQIKSINGDFTVHPSVSSDVSIIKNAQLIILGVKSWQIIDIAKQIKPFLNENAMVLPLQNGADNADKLLTVLSSNHVVAGLCKIVSKIEKPGIINHFGIEPEIIFGEYNNEITKRIVKVKSIFDKSKIKNTLSKNIHLEIWRKFLFITTISGMGALTRSVLGKIRENDFLRQKMIETAQEIVEIANKKGIDLDQIDIDKMIGVIDKLNYQTTSSLQRDMMEGKPSELDNFNGFIVKMGKELQIETPVNSFIYNSLITLENKARGE